MEYHTDLVLEGLRIVMDCTHADKGTICLKSKHPQATVKLKGAIATGKNADRTDLFELEDFYPAGDEFILVNEVLGKIVPEGGIPLNVATVVNNVESFVNISRAMQGKPVTDRYLTVCGEVSNLVVCKVPIGMPASAVIAMAGGASISDYAVVMGGPMMGRVLTDNDEPVTKTTSGIIVLPSDHTVVQGKQKSLEQMRRIAKSACTQCSRCTDLCPRYLIGHSIQPHKIMRHLAYTPGMIGDILEDALICCECGICEKFACPMMLSPREINAAIKQKVLSQDVKREAPRKTYQVSTFKETRKIPLKRLMQRLDVSQYDFPLPFYENEIRVNEVSIPLQQHIGKPAVPVVKTGDRVKKGDLIGEIPEKMLGARVHASIDGVVTSVGNNIIIKRDR